jgi:hypothetical protein
MQLFVELNLEWLLFVKCITGGSVGSLFNLIQFFIHIPHNPQQLTLTTGYGIGQNKTKIRSKR